MPHIYMDGQRIETKEGKTIIQAAYDNGLDVPHFCWHPELSVAGNCRMCLVEVGMPKKDREGNFEYDEKGEKVINYIPKLQIACSTPISDGMVVHSKNQKALEAQEAVMEFLLINHPLDCPICDEAGECKLQEYAFKHSKSESRFEETKNHKDKREPWGPNVLFDAERCISCSRCIRFAKEVAEQDVLTFVQRGDHVTIKLFDDTQFDSPYSMNVIDICPVGALTSPDFRFKARVWDMSFNESISGHDSTGTNIMIGVRNNKILRIEPKTNMYVNEYWMTDEARKDYNWINDNRIIEPFIKADGNLTGTDWDSAINKTNKYLTNVKSDEIMVLVSPKATNESAYMAKNFANDVLKTRNIDYLEHKDNSVAEDDMLLVKDKAPNAKGLKTLDINHKDPYFKAEDLKDNIENGKIKALVLVEENFKYNEHLIDVLDKLEVLVYLGYNKDKIFEKADVVLPASTFAESEGTFTNRDGRVQHFKPAVVTKENFRYMGMRMSRLDKFGSFNDKWSQHEQRNCKMSWRIIQRLANTMGANWSYKSSEEVFDEIQTHVKRFKDMDYNKIDKHHGLVLGKGDRPDPVIRNYEAQEMKPNK